LEKSFFQKESEHAQIKLMERKELDNTVVLIVKYARIVDVDTKIFVVHGTDV